MFRKPLYLCSSILLVAACGGSSSSNGGSSDNPSGSNAPSASIAIGEEFENNGTNYSAEINGITFSSSVYTSDLTTGQPVLNQSVFGDERKAYIAIQGDNVFGFGGSYSSDDGTISDFAFYGLEGSPSQVLLDGSVTYEGTYMTADASDPNNTLFYHQAILTVNFDTGEIDGTSLNNGSGEAMVIFTGDLDNNNINFTIEDQYGTHTALGAIYGPDAEELAAGFEDGVISGLLYASQ